MSIFEFVFCMLLMVLLMFVSSTLGGFLGVPEATIVVPIVGLSALALRLTKKLPSRTLLFLSARLLLATLLAIGIVRATELRRQAFSTNFLASLIALFAFVALGVIQGKLSTWRRQEQSDTDHQ
ncbi:MAG: hypothetical protein WBS24_03345 [Terriglobales bacterium]